MGVERLAYLLGALAVAAVLAFMVMNAVTDPLARERSWLETELRYVDKVPIAEIGGGSNADRWGKTILAQEFLWESLIPPPPPPPPKPPPKPKPPDIAKALEGVEASRAQIGNKVKIITPDNPRGEWMALGETIKGATLEAITRTEVKFTMKWEGGKVAHTIARN